MTIMLRSMPPGRRPERHRQRFTDAAPAGGHQESLERRRFAATAQARPDQTRHQRAQHLASDDNEWWQPGSHECLPL